MTEKHSKRSTLILADRVDIKPLSVNKVWQGRRFKTNEYKQYEIQVKSLLNVQELDFGKGPLELFLRVGFSSSASDLDNVIKPFQDILAGVYNFNDKQIYRLIAEKELVVKGAEYIEFHITRLDNPHILRPAYWVVD